MDRAAGEEKRVREAFPFTVSFWNNSVASENFPLRGALVNVKTPQQHTLMKTCRNKQK